VGIGDIDFWRFDNLRVRLHILNCQTDDDMAE